MALPLLPSKSVTVISEDHAFLTPVKLIKTIEDMHKWDRSEAYYEYLGFLYAINDAIRESNNSTGSDDASLNIKKAVALLDSISQWVDNIPPVDQQQLGGNMAFRTWYYKLKEESIDLLQKVLPIDKHRAIPEIMLYLEEGFGDSIKVQYGVGHEISFIMFLCSLFKIGFLKEPDFAATACKLFLRYLDLVRKLQLTYKMEPAGSLGLWGLDDYQYVPFIWGSAQLINNVKINPSVITKPDIVKTYADNYMFMGCIKHINEIKPGPLGENANQLWSISGLNDWISINAGLIKMYRTEMLCRFLIVQHIVFGSLFRLNRAEYGASIRYLKLHSAANRRDLPSIRSSMLPGAISETASRGVA